MNNKIEPDNFMDLNDYKSQLYVKKEDPIYIKK